MAGGGRGRLAREWRRATARLRNTGAKGSVGALWRALRLHAGAPATKALPQPRAERLVVSLTTIPARTRSLGPVLRGLLDQTLAADRIVLALPKTSLRGEAYPPAEALALPKGVEVLACQDQGPATKLLPVLHAEPQARIVVVDDDVIYPRDFLETLLDWHRRLPGAAIGYRGVALQTGNRFADLDHVFATGIAAPARVDVLFGTWGYLLPPGVLPQAVHDIDGAPPGLRWVDDVWVSGHLARAGVPRFVVPARTLPIETLASWRQALTFGVNRSGDNDGRALKHFAQDW